MLFARAALYKDGLLAATPSYEFSAARLALNALAGVVAARRPSCYPGRHSTSFAGRNQERSELGRGLKQRTFGLCLWPLGKTAMARTLVGVLFVGMAHVAHCSCD